MTLDTGYDCDCEDRECHSYDREDTNHGGGVSGNNNPLIYITNEEDTIYSNKLESEDYYHSVRSSYRPRRSTKQQLQQRSQQQSSHLHKIRKNIIKFPFQILNIIKFGFLYIFWNRYINTIYKKYRHFKYYIMRSEDCNSDGSNVACANADVEMAYTKVNMELDEDTIAQYKEQLESLSSTERNDESENQRQLGNKYYIEGSFELAVQHYTKCIIAQPNTKGYSNRAQAYLSLNKYTHALQDCDESLKLDKDNIKSKFRRGLALQHKNYYREALNEFEDVIMKKPGHLISRHHIAKLREIINSQPRTISILVKDSNGNDKIFAVPEKEYMNNKNYRDFTPVNEWRFPKTVCTCAQGEPEFITRYKKLHQERKRYSSSKIIELVEDEHVKVPKTCITNANYNQPEQNHEHELKHLKGIYLNQSEQRTQTNGRESVMRMCDNDDPMNDYGLAGYNTEAIDSQGQHNEFGLAGFASNLVDNLTCKTSCSSESKSYGGGGSEKSKFSFDFEDMEIMSGLVNDDMYDEDNVDPKDNSVNKYACKLPLSTSVDETSNVVSTRTNESIEASKLPTIEHHGHGDEAISNSELHEFKFKTPNNIPKSRRRVPLKSVFGVTNKSHEESIEPPKIQTELDNINTESVIPNTNIEPNQTHDSITNEISEGVKRKKKRKKKKTNEDDVIENNNTNCDSTKVGMCVQTQDEVCSNSTIRNDVTMTAACDTNDPHNTTTNDTLKNKFVELTTTIDTNNMHDKLNSIINKTINLKLETNKTADMDISNVDKTETNTLGETADTNTQLSKSGKRRQRKKLLLLNMKSKSIESQEGDEIINITEENITHVKDKNEINTKVPNTLGSNTICSIDDQELEDNSVNKKQMNKKTNKDGKAKSKTNVINDVESKYEIKSSGKKLKNKVQNSDTKVKLSNDNDTSSNETNVHSMKLDKNKKQKEQVSHMSGPTQSDIKKQVNGFIDHDNKIASKNQNGINTKNNNNDSKNKIISNGMCNGISQQTISNVNNVVLNLTKQLKNGISSLENTINDNDVHYLPNGGESNSLKRNINEINTNNNSKVNKSYKVNNKSNSNVNKVSNNNLSTNSSKLNKPYYDDVFVDK